MNVLFITRYQVTPQKGGIERITDIIVNALPKEYKCFSAYLNPTTLQKTKFISSVMLLKNKSYVQLYEFVKTNNIDIIINQQCIEFTDIIKKIKLDLNIRTYYFQHDKISDPWNPQRNSIKYAIKVSNNLISQIKLSLKYYCFPIYRLSKRIYDYVRYSNIYNTYDGVILLTSRYIKQYLKTINKKEDYKSKIHIINNCVTLGNIRNISYTRNNTVIIVSRLTEDRKRISLALEIWNKLQNRYNELSYWQLVLVGGGEYIDIYKSYIEKNKLNNVLFSGQVDSTLPYYASAKIFMMTSYSEGWGLTLTEAQQMGVVPICFDSYEAIHEIVNENNGILIPEGNIDEYVEKLAFLMKNERLWKNLSEESMNVSFNFSVEKILHQWISLLSENGTTK